MASKLIGKKAYITDKQSWYCGEWGIVVDKDEDGLYYVAIAGGTDSVPCFDRNQFVIKRQK